MMRQTFVVRTAFGFALLLFALPLVGERRRPVQHPPAQPEQVKLIGGYDFEMESGTALGQRVHRWQSSEGQLRVMLGDLPDGAHLTRIEIEACSRSGDPAMTFRLEQFCDGANHCDPTPDTLLEPERRMGCGKTSIRLDGKAYVVDNEGTTLWITGRMSRWDGSDKLKLFRVFYRNAVTAQMDEATMGDIPNSHPFHDFVERQAAEGLIAGCSDVKMCPESPVTRGQIASFLITVGNVPLPQAHFR